jgi:hypothetical protein
MNGRHFTRVNFLAGASIRYGNVLAKGRTSNLSICGMYLQTDHDIPLNVPVHVTVYHTNQSSFKANARVVRKEAKGVGLQINSLHIDSFAQLRDIVANNSFDSEKVVQETLSMLKCIQ